MKIKPIKGIALTLFLASTLTILLDLLSVSGQYIVWEYPTGSSGIRDVMLSNDGSLVAVGTADGRIFGIGKSGSLLWESTPVGAILSADMPRDGRYILAASADGSLYSRDGASGSLLHTFLQASSPSAVDATPGGEYFAVIHTDNTVSLFTEAGVSVWDASFIGTYADSVSVSDDGRYVAVAGTTDNTVWYFDENGESLWSDPANDTVWRVSTSVDGDYVAFGSKDRNVYFFNKTGMLWSFTTENQVNPVTISKDEQYVVAGTGDYALNGTGAYYIYLFDRTGDYLWRYQIDGTTWDVAISPDSRYVVAASQDNNIYFLNINDGALIGRYNTGSPMFSVSISSDGNYVAAASDSEVFLFSAPPMQVQLVIEVVGAGTTNPAPGNYMYDLDTVVDVTAIPDSGWVLDYWLLDGFNVGAEDPIPITMDTIHVLRAVFVARAHPVASFTFSPESPVVHETVSFDARNSYDPDGTIVSWDWDFGEGNPKTGINSTHAYGSAGTYPVTLTVTDDDGLTNTTLQSINIRKAPSSISMSASVTTFTVGESTDISGFLSPPQEGAEMLIQYRLSDGDWSTIDATYTGADGEFSFVWSPPTAGTCYVKVIWEGDMSASSCESEPLLLEVEKVKPPIGIRELFILIGVTAAVGAPSLGYAVYRLRLPKLKRAQEISKKLDEKLTRKDYKKILKDLNELIELIKDAISSGKLQNDINEPPYSIVENLKSIKDILSKGFTEENIHEILQKSEIRLYVRGIKCILKILQKPKDVKEFERKESKAHEFVALMSADSKAFDKVNRVAKPGHKDIFHDFWFSWEKDEMEPIRLCLKEGKIDKARYRWHWQHEYINKPYLDKKGRIEVFFLPHFHTPIIRRSKEDVLFLVFARCYGGYVHEYEVVHNQQIDGRYTKKEMKDSHWPTVPYQGWYTKPPCNE